jgi:hypothetical protein
MEFYYSTLARFNNDVYQLDLPDYLCHYIGLAKDAEFYSVFCLDKEVQKKVAEQQVNKSDLFRVFLFPKQESVLKNIYSAEVNLRNESGSTAAITGFLSKHHFNIETCRAIDATFGETGRVAFLLNAEAFFQISKNDKTGDDLSGKGEMTEDEKMSLLQTLNTNIINDKTLISKLHPLDFCRKDILDQPGDNSLLKFYKNLEHIQNVLHSIGDLTIEGIEINREKFVQLLDDVKKIISQCLSNGNLMAAFEEFGARYISFKDAYPDHYFNSYDYLDDRTFHKVIWKKTTSEVDEFRLLDHGNKGIEVFISKKVSAKLKEGLDAGDAKLFVTVIVNPDRRSMSFVFKDPSERIGAFVFRIKNDISYLFQLLNHLAERKVNLRIIEPQTIGSGECWFLIAGDVGYGPYKIFSVGTLRHLITADLFYNNILKSNNEVKELRPKYITAELHPKLITSQNAESSLAIIGPEIIDLRNNRHIYEIKMQLLKEEISLLMVNSKDDKLFKKLGLDIRNHSRCIFLRHLKLLKILPPNKETLFSFVDSLSKELELSSEENKKWQYDNCSVFFITNKLVHIWLCFSGENVLISKAVGRAIDEMLIGQIAMTCCEVLLEFDGGADNDQTRDKFLAGVIKKQIESHPIFDLQPFDITSNEQSPTQGSSKSEITESPEVESEIKINQADHTTTPRNRVSEVANGIIKKTKL